VLGRARHRRGIRSGAADRRLTSGYRRAMVLSVRAATSEGELDAWRRLHLAVLPDEPVSTVAELASSARPDRVAVDLHDEKLDLARTLGAEFTVNAAAEDPAEAIQRLGGADQAIALAVSPRSFEQAYGSLRRGGTLVFVALPAENEMSVPIFQTVLNGITLVGSIVGTRTDLREVFDLHAAGRTTVIRDVRPLAEVNEAIEDVEAGRVAARVVFAL
jgi:D-arabinose 1-dehydrogenase-like Zn-dependent alcohol dehydrogenase